MPKSPDAFRTISEVADWLDIQAHVLRFWESKFTQVKPIKRAGGRRYYRPNDMLLLGGIKKLLHDDGLTIKGVQKILREEGMNHVAAMSVPLDDLTASQIEATPAKPEPAPAPMIEDAEPETGVVLPFGASSDQESKVKKAPEDAELADETTSDPVDGEAKNDEAEQVEAHEAAPEPKKPEATPTQADVAEPAAEPVPEPATAAADEPLPDAPASKAEPAEVAAPQAASDQADAEADDEAEDMATPDMFEATADAAEDVPEGAPAEAEMEPMPSFLRHPAEPEAPTESAEETAATAPDVAEDNMPAEPEEVAPPPAPKPRDIGMPEVTPEAEIHAEPGALAAAFRRKPLSRAQVDQIRPLLEQLTALRDSMTAQRPSASKD